MKANMKQVCLDISNNLAILQLILDYLVACNFYYSRKNKGEIYITVRNYTRPAMYDLQPAFTAAFKSLFTALRSETPSIQPINLTKYVLHVTKIKIILRRDNP